MTSIELFKKWKGNIEIEIALDRCDVNELEQIEKDLEILEQYKNIENELGIDLVTLFKALKNGFWAKSSTGIAFYKEDEEHTIFIRHLGYDVEICCEESENAIGSKCLMYLERSTKNYGKTWALTKEELENEATN